MPWVSTRHLKFLKAPNHTHTLDVVGGMLAAVMTRQLDATPWMIRGFDLKNACTSSAQFRRVLRLRLHCRWRLFLRKTLCVQDGGLAFRQCPICAQFPACSRVANSLWSILSTLLLVINKRLYVRRSCPRLQGHPLFVRLGNFYGSIKLRGSSYRHHTGHG